METVEKTKVETNGKIKEVDNSNRLEILHSVIDMSYAFAENSYRLLTALSDFEKKESKMMGTENTHGFRIILSEMISLLDRRDEAIEWIEELGQFKSELEQLEN